MLVESANKVFDANSNLILSLLALWILISESIRRLLFLEIGLRLLKQGHVLLLIVLHQTHLHQPLLAGYLSNTFSFI